MLQGTQLPYLDGLTYIMVEDNSAQNLQLQSGSVDCQPQTIAQGSQALFADSNLRVDIYPGTGIREVAFNMTKAPWKDPKGQSLRQAVAYCLDRKAINQALYEGKANLGYDTFWEPTVFPGSPTPPVRAQDYTKAKQLLTDGGMPNGMSITLTVAKYLENPQLAQLIQAQCKPAGINVTINQISSTAFYAGGADYYATTPWIVAPMTIVEWGSRPAPGIYAAAMLLPGAVWSSSHWNDPQFLSGVQLVPVDHRRGGAHEVRDAAVHDAAGRHADHGALLHHPAAHAEEERLQHPGSRLVLLRLQRGVQDRVRPATDD